MELARQIQPINQIKLTDHQQGAYDQLYDFAVYSDNAKSKKRLFVLEGYAGTGKSTLISELIRDMDDLGELDRVAIAAPTNKAVKVLREKMGFVATGLEFGSIHSFLGLRMQEKENGEQSCKKAGDSTLHNYDLVIVDESSMLGKDIYKMILTSMGPVTRVIFIGDPAQLPPVGEKKKSPVFDTVQEKAVLNQVVRQAQDNPIIKLSMAIREAIQEDRMISAQEITENLPPVDEGPNACVAYGGADTITQWSLYELKQGRDCRIIAYTNRQVNHYNELIHEDLYGVTVCKFSVGEHVIVHQQTEVQAESGRVNLHTSEELQIVDIEEIDHPKWPDIEAFHLTLARDSGVEVQCYIPADEQAFEDAIAANFKTWRELKSQAKQAKASGDHEYPLIEAEAKKYSSRAWAMRKSFAPLRHCYAITAHKSQGSTFDTAIIDFSDMGKIRTAFDFNRALYVAITRPRSYLAIVL